MGKTNGLTTMNGNSHINEHMITLNIRIPRDSTVHSMQFDVQMLINDISHNIQQHLLMTIDHDRKKDILVFLFLLMFESMIFHNVSASEYGLFINDEQYSSRSYWLDPTKTLSYYALKNGV